MKHFLTYKHVFVQAVIEFGPILMFVALFEVSNFFVATVGMIVATILLTAVSIIREKHIPLFPLTVTLFTLVFGFLTIVLHDERILMLRDTLYDLFFALLIFGGLLRGKLVLKTFFHKLYPLTEYGYKYSSYVWGGYFLTTATINELIRHLGTEAQWVHFKSINILLTILVALFLMSKLKTETLSLEQDSI